MSGKVNKVQGMIRDFQVRPERAVEVGKRQMTPAHQSAAQEAILLINHHRMLAQQIEGNLREMVIQEYGVDLATGEWLINLQTGELVQRRQ